ncbi:hypothetical protein DEO72_LG6g1418 [Vigna unguiculata]|uniref:Uncharacterized protein n=1 Tax=Vigna unguiculata TaxID=3917 RepID=A0A4D6M7Q5_VIGUN|nr:hypothetical protein DEO72_LG6g1418 [Vigna unguiculata]
MPRLSRVLAWASVSRLSEMVPHSKQELSPKRELEYSPDLFMQVSPRSIQLQSITKQYKILDLTPNKHEGSSCPYLEKATQTTSTLKRMSTKVPEADLRAENPNTKGVRDYYKELRRTKLAKKSTS